MAARFLRMSIGTSVMLACCALLLWLPAEVSPRDLGELTLFSGLMAAANAEVTYLFWAFCGDRHRASQGRWMSKIVLLIHGLLCFSVICIGTVLALLGCVQGYHATFAVHAVFCALLCLVTLMLVSES